MADRRFRSMGRGTVASGLFVIALQSLVILEAHAQAPGRPGRTPATRPGPAAKSPPATPTAPATKAGPAAKTAPGAKAETPLEAGPTTEPTTTEQAVEVVDLISLPRLNVVQVFDESPTSITYQAKAGIKSADAFYRETLEEEGWKSAGAEDRTAAEYSDRLYQKSGYYLRVMIGAVGEKGMASVTVSNLGNVDVRRLPRHDSAAANEGSSPVNVTYFTKLPIADAGKYCQDQLAKAGWKEIRDESLPPSEATHVKMLKFRKNDAVIHVVVHRDPNKLAEGPTSVSLLSMPVIGPEIEPKAPAAAVAATRPGRPSAKPATVKPSDEDDAVATKPTPTTTDESEEEDLAAQIRREVEATLKKELGGLNKELGDLNLGKPTKGKIPPGKVKLPIPKSLNIPGISGDKPSEDDEEDRPVKKKAAAKAEFFTAGTIQGHITFDGTKYELKHAAAIRYQDRDETVTIVYCAGKALKTDKLVRGKPGDVSVIDLVGFDSPCISVRSTKDFASFNSYVDGKSISVSSSKIKSDIDLVNGHLKGKAFLAEPEEFFDKEYQFELTIDLTAAPKGGAGDKDDSENELAPSEDSDLPLPEDHSQMSRERTPYRTVLGATVDAPLAQVVKFYRKHLGKQKYVENAKLARLTDESAFLSFTGPNGPLVVQLTSEDASTKIEVVSRQSELAKKHGIIPIAGQARLLLANASDVEAIVKVDGKSHKVGAGVGGKDPQAAVKLDLQPGKHTITVVSGGEQSEPEEIEVMADSSWGVIVAGPGMTFTTQVY